MSERRKFLVASEEGYSLGSTEDALYLIGNLYGWNGVLLTEGDLAPAFFNLRSGLAGELLQKFINYRVRVAIVLTNPDRYGERFAELVWEHRTHPLIRFFPSQERAEVWLGAN